MKRQEAKAPRTTTRDDMRGGVMGPAYGTQSSLLTGTGSTRSNTLLGQ